MRNAVRKGVRQDYVSLQTKRALFQVTSRDEDARMSVSRAAVPERRASNGARAAHARRAWAVRCRDRNAPRREAAALNSQGASAASACANVCNPVVSGSATRRCDAVGGESVCERRGAYDARCGAAPRPRG